ncbi:MAG: ABC transporter substrate-binding protein [Nocardioides sp.]
MSARTRALAAGFLGSLLLAGCTDGGAAPPQPPSTSSASASTGRIDLTFGVYGSADEVAGYDDMVTEFNSLSEESSVSVVSWPDRDRAMAELGSSEDLPDVFLISRGDLATFQRDGQVQPVDELLDARGVDFGDGYSRDALLAFSLENRLQCMPYGISPMVIYLNTDLVDFDRMRARGLPAPAPGADSETDTDTDPEPPRAWSFEQFAAAAEFATRPRRRTRGVSIEASLGGLAPFIVSGGGTVFDSDSEPTSLAFSDEASRNALETTLALLRNAQVTLSPEQLAEAPALDWFERGQVAMIAGFRELVPDLRQVQGLTFDVMPIPVIESSGTIGDITGLCLSADTANAPEAADFLAHALSEASVTAVARAGYLVPANVAVAASDQFLQPGRLPANSAIFNTAVRDIYIPPLISDVAALEEIVAPSIAELISRPGAMDAQTIEEITAVIDEQSRLVLSPDEVSPTP